MIGDGPVVSIAEGRIGICPLDNLAIVREVKPPDFGSAVVLDNMEDIFRGE